jgi:hypothetical protein
MGSLLPGRRCVFLGFNISPPAASYNCDGSKSYKARCLFGTIGVFCRSSPPLAAISSVVVGEALQIGSGRSSGRIGLLFSFSFRGFRAKVDRQLSSCILLSLYLYLYSNLPIIFLTTV